ncbi:MAG: caspase family protein [Planctomycetales bacterium]|nr:caspase family protein [Planctomycetales bacterium]
MGNEKRALLMGINDYKNVSDLRGCVNDVIDVQKLLTERFGFKSSDVHTLLDKQVVKQRFKKEWSWLTKDAGEGDSLVVFFAGHGSQIADENDDEDDGVDELLCLYDMDFDDPSTYILDDEWEKMIREAKGAHLTFIFDCCHSGTGLRLMLAPPGQSAPPPEKRPQIDPGLTVQRYADRHGVRALGAAAHDISNRALRGEDDDAVVRVRYIEPPPHVLARMRNGVKRNGFRALARSTKGHAGGILLAGCKADQTSADANIDGTPRGAFSHAFCKVVRAAGESPTYPAILREVERTLAGRFSQIPQLEPKDFAGVLFSDMAGTPKDEPHSQPQGASPGKPKGTAQPGQAGVGSSFTNGAGSQTSIDTLIDAIQALSAAGSVNADLIVKLSDLIKTLAQNNAGSRSGISGGRAMVYVHGICVHPEGYSKDWWTAMRDHLPSGLRQELEANRLEVLWSDLVTRDSARTALGASGGPRELQRELEFRERNLKDDLIATLTDRALIAGQSADDVQPADREPRPSESKRAFLGIPGLDCIDDFVKYLTRNGIRRDVQRRFLHLVLPRLEVGDEVEVISHSWGTVVAYEALRGLDQRPDLRGRVTNFFTVGSALSIRQVVRMLETDDLIKPRCVQSWINLDAHGDIVGGTLAARGFAVDEEFLQLEAVDCSRRFPSPACAHRSYFLAQNLAVNRDIFAHKISQR